jgi:hypothetical protein
MICVTPALLRSNEPRCAAPIDQVNRQDHSAEHAQAGTSGIARHAASALV